MRLRDLYTEYFANWLTSGSFILRDKLSALGIKPSFDRILTKKYVIKVWMITSFPVDYSNNITHMIRTEMFKTDPNVKTKLYYVAKSVVPQVKSDVFRRQLATASSKYEDYKSVFEGMSEADRLTGKVFRGGGGRKFIIRKEDMKKLRDRYESYAYTYKHATEGGSFFNTNVFIIAYARTNEEINEYRKGLTNILVRENLYFYELQGNMSQFLSNFGPAVPSSLVEKGFNTVFMSDENLASICATKTRGLVGGDGIMIGIDQMSKFPLMINFMASTSVQVGILLAESGWGKTFLANMMAIAFIAEGHHCSVVDIKGGEWEKASSTVDTLNISMGDQNARFVNVMRLNDITVSKDNARFFYYTAIYGAVQLFTIMTNLAQNEGNKADLASILETAAIKVMDNRHVYKDNPNTFINTAGLKLVEVIDMVGELGENTDSYTDNQRELCKLVVSRCAPYFKMEGPSSEAFRREITLAEVISTPMVIYSFDKNNSTGMSILDNLKTFMCKFLSLKKQFIRKIEGLFTIDFFEEMQRVDEEFIELLKFISGDVTGGRSNHVVIFLLLNSITSFVGREASAIKSNITTVIAGNLFERDIKVLADEFDCEDLIPYLKAVSSDDPAYKNAFAIKYNNGIETDKTIVKAVPPEYLEKELRTRDVVVS